MRWPNLSLLLKHMLFVGLAFTCGGKTYDLESALQEIEKKKHGVHCVWYKVEGTQVIPAGSRSDFMEPNSFPPRDVVNPFSAEVLIDFDGQQFQLESKFAGVLVDYNSKGEPYGKVQRKNEFWVYEDGRLARHHKEITEGKGDTYPTEIPDVHFHGKDYPVLSFRYAPFFIAHGYVPFSFAINDAELFSRNLRDAGMTLKNESSIRDHRCLVIRTPELGKTGRVRELFVDINEGFNIVRLNHYRKRIGNTLDMEYELDQGVWIPRNNIWTMYNADGSIQRDIIDFKVVDFKLNPDYDQLRRDIAYQPGMLIADHSTENMLFVDENNDLQVMEEVGKRSKRGLVSSLFYIALFLIIAMAVIAKIWAKKKLHSTEN